MSLTSASRTRASLLERLRACPTDQAAWREFVANYGPKILGWCRHWDLQESDAEDVTQDVLQKLAKVMARFEYDPSRSFRAWLKTIAHHAWQDFVTSRRQADVGCGGSQVIEVLEGVEAREDLERRLDEAFDRELRTEAEARVRRRVAPQTWEAYCLRTGSPLVVPEIAARVGMKVAMVYVAYSKVRKMLREEIRKLKAN